MISIAGTLQAGEAQGTQRAIRARMHGADFGVLIFFAALAIGIVAGIGIAAFFDDIIDMPNLSWPASAFGAIFVVLACNRICRKWSLRRFRRNMQLRGLATNFSYSLSLGDDQLILETQWARNIAPWASVTEVIRSKGYWIFLVGFDPWFAPSRFFSDDEEERRFIAMAVMHLSNGALGRSQDAVAFSRA